MISREKSFRMIKALSQRTWVHLPKLMECIPATAVAGKILGELIQIYEEAKELGQTQEEQAAKVNQLIEKCGGEAQFKKKVREELKAERNPKNPAYINCVIFEVNADDSLSEAEQQKLTDTLTGDLEPENTNIERFVSEFREDYFGDNYDACENAIETGEDYIAFNFDDMSDHTYDENDLKIICDMLNQIVGRTIFNEYEGYGTDNSCEY